MHISITGPTWQPYNLFPSTELSPDLSHKLKHFDATTRAGSHYHVWLPSPTNTGHKLLAVFICHLSSYRVDRTKLMRSYWHREGFVVRKYLHAPKSTWAILPLIDSSICFIEMPVNKWKILCLPLRRLYIFVLALSQPIISETKYHPKDEWQKQKMLFFSGKVRIQIYPKWQIQNFPWYVSCISEAEDFILQCSA